MCAWEMKDAPPGVFVDGLFDVLNDALKSRKPAFIQWVFKRYPAVCEAKVRFDPETGVYVKMEVSSHRASEFPGQESCPRYLFVPVRGVLEMVPVTCRHLPSARVAIYCPKRGDRSCVMEADGITPVLVKTDKVLVREYLDKLAVAAELLRTLDFIDCSAATSSDQPKRSGWQNPKTDMQCLALDRYTLGVVTGGLSFALDF